AHDSYQNQRERDRRPGARTPERSGVMDQIIENGRVENGRSIEVLAGHGRADHREDSSADHRTNAQRRQLPRPQGFSQPGFRTLRVRYELVYGLLGEQLIWQ